MRERKVREERGRRERETVVIPAWNAQGRRITGLIPMIENRDLET